MKTNSYATKVMGVRFGFSKQGMAPWGGTWAERSPHMICLTTGVKRIQRHMPKGAPATGNQAEREPEMEDKTTRKFAEDT